MKKLCVLLHGYGADAEDLESLIPVFKERLDDTANDFDFISVSAPMPCEQGMGLQWYSLADFWQTVPYGLPFKMATKSLQGLENAKKYLSEILDKELEKRNLNYSDLILIGFSQGASLAEDFCLNFEGENYPKKCVMFSGFTIPNSVDNIKNYNTEFLLCHGEIDDVVPLDLFEENTELLMRNEINFHTIISPNTGHFISEEGMVEAIKFLKK